MVEFNGGKGGSDGGYVGTSGAGVVGCGDDKYVDGKRRLVGK